MSNSILTILLFAALGLTIGAVLTRANMCMMRLASQVSEGHVGAVRPVLIVFSVGALVTVLAERFGFRDPAPWTWPTWTTFVGAMLIGVGARLNFACSIGTMGRLASGDLGGLATIAGAVLSMLVMPHTMLSRHRPEWAADAQLGWVGIIAAATIVIVLAFRGSARLERFGAAALLGATTALFYGWWTNVDFAEIAQVFDLAGHFWLIVGVAIPCVVVGGVLGMRYQGNWRLQLPRRNRLLPEFLGGVLMGAGAHLLPGASDSLVFYGVPSGSPHAIIAWIIMFGTIVLTFRVRPGQFANDPRHPAAQQTQQRPMPVAVSVAEQAGR
jgi:hypothetical protein